VKQNKWLCQYIMSVVDVAGWQWEPADRPTFREIHIALDNMIHTSSAGEGMVHYMHWFEFSQFYLQLLFIVLVLHLWL